MSDQVIQNISADLKQRIEQFKPDYDIEEIGTVLEAGDGIAVATGLLVVVVGVAGVAAVVDLQIGCLDPPQLRPCLEEHVALRGGLAGHVDWSVEPARGPAGLLSGLRVDAVAGEFSSVDAGSERFEEEDPHRHGVDPE